MFIRNSNKMFYRGNLTKADLRDKNICSDLFTINTFFMIPMNSSVDMNVCSS